MAGTTNWTVRDNLFDSMAYLGDYGSTVNNWTNAYYFSGTAGTTTYFPINRSGRFVRAVDISFHRKRKPEFGVLFVL